MNVGSLFAGIGGFDLGFERCGMRVAWQVEQDPYCRAVLERHFPAAQRFEDVRKVGAKCLGPVDLICGGFPCQDLSTAGRGAGLAGGRSGLWSEFARVVDELRPGYVVVENVPALLTGKGKRWDRAPIGRVLGDLAEMGYDSEWACISAEEFGAPHLRKRIWIVAYPQNQALADAAGVDEERAVGGGGRCRRSEAASRDGRCSRSGRSSWPTEPGVGRVADGVPHRVDRLAALGNALLPQIAEWIGRGILDRERIEKEAGRVERS